MHIEFNELNSQDVYLLRYTQLIQLFYLGYLAFSVVYNSLVLFYPLFYVLLFLPFLLSFQKGASFLENSDWRSYKGHS